MLNKQYGKVGSLLSPFIENFTGLNQLAKDYDDLSSTNSTLEFIKTVLNYYSINIDVKLNELSNIPKEGPTVIVANHPFGAIEGLILARLILDKRQDVKIIANYHLSRIFEIKELFLAVDPFENRASKKNNTRPMREAIRQLENGGVILAFPAGEVSHWNIKNFSISDPKWNPNIAKLIQKTKANVVPIHIEGRNSFAFHAMGTIHPRLRTLMLAREFLKRKNNTIRLNIGKTIIHNELFQFYTPKDLTDFLRKQTYCVKRVNKSAINCPIAMPKETQMLVNDVNKLNSTEKLFSNGKYDVYCAKGANIPNILHEIGRLREISFRATGEGTGKSIDLDIYDNYYYHLFIWNKTSKEIIGAYRLGLTDEILSRYGKKGLYTHSLFKYKTQLLHQLTPSVELGRSFIKLEYQREYTPLMLLWKGIGTFVTKNPKYRTLFGPVSISNDYCSMSRQMMVEFLRHNNYDTDRSKLVKARSPFRLRRFNDQLMQLDYRSNLDALTNAVTQTELDNKGIPVLIKQYLKLGGQILGFNIDKEFTNALDALIMVDLMNTETKILQRYMGKDGVMKFYQHHQDKEKNTAIAS